MNPIDNSTSQDGILKNMVGRSVKDMIDVSKNMNQEISLDVLSTELAKKFTVRHYFDLVDGFDEIESRTKLASFVHKRFKERFIDPIRIGIDAKCHGFSTAASCCLMIESLECFREGLGDTIGPKVGQGVFSRFFLHQGFEDLRNYSDGFYFNVRCGILHQAEITNGWKITRTKQRLFDSKTRTLSATCLLTAVSSYLDRYRNELVNATIEDELWANYLFKMNIIINNCISLSDANLKSARIA